ncbi:MAG TPA: ATP-binding protein [Bryobacteraceae bacterium]|nr:ATP-binding protein [Bryobacteraceae bacterium]
MTKLYSATIRTREDVAAARRRARDIAALLGFDANDRTRISTAVSEIARNACDCAAGGEAEFLFDPAQSCYTIRVSEKGPGIPGLEEVLGGKLGMAGDGRLVDDFHVDCEAGGGAIVSLSKHLPERAPKVTEQRLSKISAELARGNPSAPIPSRAQAVAGGAQSAGETARVPADEWEAIFEAIRDGVALVDAEGRILRSNQSLARLLGRPAPELDGMACDELWSRLPREKQPFFRALESRRREAIELECDSRRLNISIDPMFDAGGAPAGGVLIAGDVTEKRRLEEQFRESQKFETIGTLAAGVAHDFNNLLTSIMGNASLVLEDLPADSPFSERLQDVLRAAERAAGLTHQLLAYSGKGGRYLQKVDLSGATRNCRDLIAASIPKKIALEVDLDSRLPRIEADVNQLQQVILNLVSNAAEAIGEQAGTIVVRTTSDVGELVCLEVRDTGCGMDAETRSRIFDPFFTTKFTGRGLGLAAVAGIARGHRASLHVTSAPGEGSTFRISFPAAEEPAPAVPPAAVESAAAGTILVVDDEDVVQRFARAALEAQGHKVLVASNGPEAIAQVRRNPEIGLVLLDLTMPMMGGEEAIDGIVSARPGIRVVVSTGYDHAEAVARFREKPVAGFLQKPYTPRQLADQVQAVLDDRSRF